VPSEAALVRPAAPGDLAAIHRFILDLADYERLAHEVDATPTDLARDLFGPAPRVFCDIAEIGGVPVGFALWFYSYSTFRGRHGIWLEDLFVRPERRGAGAGLALLRRRRPCAAGMVGAGLERSGHRFLRPPRSPGDGRLDDPAPDRRRP
jgi:GNAT superfamily N-acetyltransferase